MSSTAAQDDANSAPPAHNPIIVDNCYQTMAKGTPNRHAGLVTFSGEVSLIGDGSGDARIVAGDRLRDEEALRDVGRSYPLSQPVLQARERLRDRLFALEEGGPTALGPAVIVGLSMLNVSSQGDDQEGE